LALETLVLLVLCDKYSPCKLLSGLGGVGKTTLVREFAEDVVRNEALGLEKVIWLSAKQQFYTALQDRYVSTSRVDFLDVKSLLSVLLTELGYLDSEIDKEWDSYELIEEVVKALQIIPSLIIIDDVDSLEPEQQNEVFQVIVRIAERTIDKSKIPSRAILTARLDLGAAPSQLMKISGLVNDEFVEYLRITCDQIGLSLKISSKQQTRFHRITDGSPTFAASILRLLQLGMGIDEALEKWKGSHGNEVRRFAFEKELSNLTDSQVRTLYAACTLGETTLLELQQITQSNNTLLLDDLGHLRQYHLLVSGDDVQRGGVKLSVPSGIRLMIDLIKPRVANWSKIEAECLKAKKGSPILQDSTGQIVRQVIALWKDNRMDEALEVARLNAQTNKKSGDLQCLLGRAYLMLDLPHYQQAEVAFKKAFDLGCRKIELSSLWIKAKQYRKDWYGIIELTQQLEEVIGVADVIYYKAQAYLELASMNERSNMIDKALDSYNSGINEIEDAWKANQARGRGAEILEIRSVLYQGYLSLLSRANSKAEEGIVVWDAIMNAFVSRFRRVEYISLGIIRLEQFWKYAEQRVNEEDYSQKMQSQLPRLNHLINVLKKEAWDENLIRATRKAQVDLQKRYEKYIGKRVS
jgi:tetratricopeptide (TPR) repeat protein